VALERGRLLAFMRDQLGVDTDDIDDSTPLFSSGRIDSFSLVSLVIFLEDATGSRIALGDVTLENLDTVGRMLAFAGRLP
jgi:acyl carrier protein